MSRLSHRFLFFKAPTIKFSKDFMKECGMSTTEASNDDELSTTDSAPSQSIAEVEKFISRIFTNVNSLQQDNLDKDSVIKHQQFFETQLAADVLTSLAVSPEDKEQFEVLFEAIKGHLTNLSTACREISELPSPIAAEDLKGLKLIAQLISDSLTESVRNLIEHFKLKGLAIATEEIVNKKGAIGQVTKSIEDKEGPAFTVLEATPEQQARFDKLPEKEKEACDTLAQLFEGIERYAIIGSIATQIMSAKSVGAFGDIDCTIASSDKAKLMQNLKKFTNLYRTETGTEYVTAEDEEKIALYGPSGRIQFFIQTEEGPPRVDCEIFSEGVSDKGEANGIMQLGVQSRSVTAIKTESGKPLNMAGPEMLQNLYIFNFVEELTQDTVNSFAENSALKSKTFLRVAKLAIHLDVSILAGIIGLLDKTKAQYLAYKQCPEMLEKLNRFDVVKEALSEMKQGLENFAESKGISLENSTIKLDDPEAFLSFYGGLNEAKIDAANEITLIDKAETPAELLEAAKSLKVSVAQFDSVFEAIKKDPVKNQLEYYTFAYFVKNFLRVTSLKLLLKFRGKVTRNEDGSVESNGIGKMDKDGTVRTQLLSIMRDLNDYRNEIRRDVYQEVTTPAPEGGKVIAFPVKKETEATSDTALAA